MSCKEHFVAIVVVVVVVLYCCCSTVHVGVARYSNVFKLDMLRPMWAQIGQEGDMLSGCKWLMRELELNGGITILFITIITIVFITINITLIITITNINELCLGQAMTWATDFIYFCICNDLGHKLTRKSMTQATNSKEECLIKNKLSNPKAT